MGAWIIGHQYVPAVCHRGYPNTWLTVPGRQALRALCFDPFFFHRHCFQADELGKSLILFKQLPHIDALAPDTRRTRTQSTQLLKYMEMPERRLGCGVWGPARAALGSPPKRNPAPSPSAPPTARCVCPHGMALDAGVPPCNQESTRTYTHMHPCQHPCAHPHARMYAPMPHAHTYDNRREKPRSVCAHPAACEPDAVGEGRSEAAADG